MQERRAWPVVRKVLCTLFLLGNIVFIFYNSSQIGDVSGSISRGVLEWINGVLANMGVSFRFTHTLIRKLGHFGEYTLLGFWLMLALRVYTGRLLAHISWPLLGGLLVAVADEFYQTFVPGRSGEVRDVIIDFGGVVFGIGMALVLIVIITGLGRAIFGRKKSKPPAPQAQRRHNGAY